ncbi:multidrug resistance protein homolog 65 [Musca domestica]|uniref:Multidrug resistance protein homolog 65 n=1 Tax=Musca domestica TaxID=7370 RepID=A0A9J7CWA5_MUSDO|nr:multidrug resistance protein homolog 65 [Musca domestica]
MRDPSDNKKSKKKSKMPQQQRDVGFFELFSFATRWEYFLLAVAFVAAFLKSLVFPIIIVVYSELVAMFVDRNLCLPTTKTYFLPLFGGGKYLYNGTFEENMEELRNDSMSFGIICALDSLLMFISGIIYVDLFNHVALNIVVRMRRDFFAATIRQDIGWHDMAQNQNFAVRITDNMEKIRNGISETIGHFVMMFFDIVISILISFIYGWRLTLAICAYIPLTMVINYLISKYQSKLTTEEQNVYARAASVVEEIISSIRTVVAFGGEKSERDRYDDLLKPGLKTGKIKGVFLGLGDSVLKSMLFISSAGAFWYGAHLILDDRFKEPEFQEYTPSILMIVICGIIVGADHIARTSPFLEAFASARGSAVAIYEVLEAESKIDPLSSEGKVVNYGLKCNIEFQDIFFAYPSRPDTIVLRGFNLKINEGETVALVGYSGSGKSTCVQLLQRFYDPIFGKVMLNEEDIRKYNVNWLRSQMAVVGQEPVLFYGTIEENIRHGKMDATQKEIEDAARAGGAHDFIIGLPEGYNTVISEKGVQLSGGQRQRIAIARALIQNPKILLLDEATSALDYHSEKLVQAALDGASKGRTTLVVSHRLSAIRSADRIIFIDKGKVVEEGNHDSLMKLKGRYYDMVTAHQYENLLDNEDAVDNKETDDVETEKVVAVVKPVPNGVNVPRFSEASLDKNMIQAFAARCSLTDPSMKEMATIEKTQYLKTFHRVVQWARPEWGFLSIAAVCALLYGCAQPAFAFVFADLFGSLNEIDEADVLRNTGRSAIIAIVVGVLAGVTCFTQTYFFNLAGLWFTTRLRSITIGKILGQEMAWFDRKENSVGALSARLSGDASGVQGAIGFPLSNMLQAFSNFVCSFSIAFSYSWELALICLTTAPFMVASVIFEAKYTNKSAVKEKEILEETSRIATETIAQIRTVAALRRENDLIKTYDIEVERYRQEIKKKLRYRGVINSLGMSIMFLGYAITLTYGGYMCADGRIKFENIMKISNSMLYGLFILAQSLAFTPMFNAALVSADRIFSIIDRDPEIKSPEVSSAKNYSLITGKSNAVQGVSFQDIHFRYPTRRDQRVLNGLNLEVLQGKTVALVGASGCGKSTCVQLLLRYYDPDSGSIYIDQDDIHHDLTLSALRKRIGIVSQEPSLFEKTIAENIAYGDTSRTVPMEEILLAAKMANAHDFISALPSGYETCLGARGTQLSGGQKQRIAIARALVRNPKILLLDEATSALDLQSERLVQTALDEACSGRTCLVIAHRLATVQNADVICVIQNGRVIEQGNHPQLLAKNGIYAKLYLSQPSTH